MSTTGAAGCARPCQSSQRACLGLLHKAWQGVRLSAPSQYDAVQYFITHFAHDLVKLVSVVMLAYSANS